jgi:HK97 gp10 family phage protein
MALSSQIARIRKKLKAVAPSIEKAVAASLEKSAQEIVDLAKSLCPVDRGDLRNSIGWTWGDAPDGAIVLAASEGAAMRITIYAGSDDAFYVRWVEFGHSTASPQPFFLPAYRTLRKRIKNRTNRDTKKAIDKVMKNG